MSKEDQSVVCIHMIFWERKMEYLYVIGANGDKISMNDVSVHNRSLGLDILHYSGTTIPPHIWMV